MRLTVAIILAAITAATIIAFVATRRHPEMAATHPGEDDVDESTAFFGRSFDRPGGPGAESDGVADRGSPAPGPSASSLEPRTHRDTAE
jgi:hypothetical protein